MVVWQAWARRLPWLAILRELGALLRPPAEGRSFPSGHLHHQPHQTTLEEQQAARRAEWEARDLGVEAERDSVRLEDSHLLGS